MLCQVITAVLKDKGDKTKVRAVAAASSAPHDNAHSRSTQVSLIFANQTEDDILCRKVRDLTVSPARGLAYAVHGAGAGSASCRKPQL